MSINITYAPVDAGAGLSVMRTGAGKANIISLSSITTSVRGGKGITPPPLIKGSIAGFTVSSMYNHLDTNTIPASSLFKGNLVYTFSVSPVTQYLFQGMGLTTPKIASGSGHSTYNPSYELIAKGISFPLLAKGVLDKSNLSETNSLEYELTGVGSYIAKLGKSILLPQFNVSELAEVELTGNSLNTNKIAYGSMIIALPIPKEANFLGAGYNYNLRYGGATEYQFKSTVLPQLLLGNGLNTVQIATGIIENYDNFQVFEYIGKSLSSPSIVKADLVDYQSSQLVQREFGCGYIPSSMAAGVILSYAYIPVTIPKLGKSIYSSQIAKSDFDNLTILPNIPLLGKSISPSIIAKGIGWAYSYIDIKDALVAKAFKPSLAGIGKPILFSSAPSNVRYCVTPVSTLAKATYSTSITSSTGASLYQFWS